MNGSAEVAVAETTSYWKELLRAGALHMFTIYCQYYWHQYTEVNVCLTYQHISIICLYQRHLSSMSACGKGYYPYICTLCLKTQDLQYCLYTVYTYY